MKMKRQVVLAVGLLLLVVVLVACGASQKSDVSSDTMSAKNADGYTDISVDQLAQMLENKDFTLVNVHIPYEGEIPGTDVFVPFNAVEQNLDKLPQDKSAPIVLYCRSGSMSTIAAKKLVSLGYTNVYEVDGGFNAWKASGRDLVFKQ